MAEGRKNASEMVFGKLFQMLTDGSYSPGDKLPSENELSQKFAVSRNTIREALNRLNVMGITETYHGDGTYLRSFGTTMFLNTFMPSVLAHIDDFSCLLNFRRGIEVMSARLAAENATPRDIQNMQEYFDTLSSDTISADEFARMTSDFHRKIAAASKNKLLETLLEQITWIITSKMADFVAYRPNVADSSYYHSMIFQCIKYHKPDEAAFMMDRHMQLLIDTTTEYLKQEIKTENRSDEKRRSIQVTNIYHESKEVE